MLIPNSISLQIFNIQNENLNSFRYPSRKCTELPPVLHRLISAQHSQKHITFNVKDIYDSQCRRHHDLAQKYVSKFERFYAIAQSVKLEQFDLEN